MPTELVWIGGILAVAAGGLFFILLRSHKACATAFSLSRGPSAPLTFVPAAEPQGRAREC